MGYDDLGCLMLIAEKRGLFGKLKTSTSELGKHLNVSQQTVSRKLRELEKKGLIKRNVSLNGITISIDAKGRDFLKNIYGKFENIFGKKESIAGKVISGIGEGSYYVMQPGYQKQFLKKLGFKAYPGTLNLEVNEEDTFGFLASINPITIDGFKTNDRTYGKLTCYKITIVQINGFIVIPERTKYGPDIFEIIAPVNLRDKLKIKDNSKVKLTK